LLQDGQSEDPIPVGARFSTPIQTAPEAHPAYTNGTRSVSAGKAAGVWCWPHIPI